MGCVVGKGQKPHYEAATPQVPFASLQCIVLGLLDFPAFGLVTLPALLTAERRTF